VTGGGAALAQFDLILALAELHFDALREDDFLWAPTELHWTVHPDEDGLWYPDWADTEPDPIPVPTIAWLTWQMTWWWSTALDDLAELPHRRREDVAWPGTGAAAVAEIRSLAARWRDAVAELSEADLQRPSRFPWPADAGKTVTDSVFWVNVELTKNISEIGQLRLLRAALIQRR
jgi:DinB family protein